MFQEGVWEDFPGKRVFKQKHKVNRRVAVQLARESMGTKQIGNCKKLLAWEFLKLLRNAVCARERYMEEDARKEMSQSTREACIVPTWRRANLVVSTLCLQIMIIISIWLSFRPCATRGVTVWVINDQPKNSSLNNFHYEWCKKPWRDDVIYNWIYEAYLGHMGLQWKITKCN